MSVAVALVPSAQARTIKLNWIEKADPAFGYPAMTFKVRDVVVTSKAWAVRASITNRSSKAVRIVRPNEYHPPQYGFGLGWAPKCEPPAISCRFETRRRTYSKPAIPAVLRPRQTWTGVFGGPGKVARSKLVNVTFGYFEPTGGQKSFSWLTQNAFKL
jgi:hypothetical protein